VQYTVLSVAGLKGELSQAELHFLKARMRGGVLNKARRGELEMGPPVGLIYLPDGRIGLDPDQQVQSAIRMIFETFERTGSAMQAVRFFREHGLRLPRRIRGGANKGDLLWAEPVHSRILQILHNPRYAGAFVYGRTRAGRKADGKYTAVRVPREKWQYLIPNVHAGYISWDQYEANQKRLAENILAFATSRKFGPVREGPAILQGRVLCGICGERMGVHYWAENGNVVSNYVCQEATIRRGTPMCQSVPGRVVDRAISDLLLELVQPLTLEVALAVQQEVEARFAETDTLRRQLVERARYEAELSRRRYMSVDPGNRLVTDVLEADWNEKLRIHAAAQQDYERYSAQQLRVVDQEARQKILSITTDFSRIWNDPELPARERKRMLRLLIEDVTLLKADKITAHVLLRGGAMRTLTIERPVPMAQIRKPKAAVIAEVDRLLDEHCDREVAEILNQLGYRTWQNLPFTRKKVEWIRVVYHLKSRFGRLRERGLLTAKEMSAALGIAETTVHEWARNGLLRRIVCDNRNHSLYEPLQNATTIVKGHGGRGAAQPVFTVAQSEQGAV
jgi:hypothetical protein